MRFSLPTGGRRAATLAAACALSAGASACGSSHTTSAGTRQGAVIPVTEHDFRIEAPGRLHAGRYTFAVTNEGSTYHEFIIAPLSGARLQLRPDGLTVAEEAVQAREPGSLEPGAPGATRQLTVDLSPGRYVLFCNMEGHYMGGMHHEVVVG